MIATISKVVDTTFVKAVEISLGFVGLCPTEPGVVRTVVWLTLLWAAQKFGKFVVFNGADFMRRIKILGLYIAYATVWTFKPLHDKISRLWTPRSKEEPYKAEIVIGGPPAKHGYFHWNDKDFFRHDDGSVQKGKLKGIRTTVDPDGYVTTSYDFEPVEPATRRDMSPGECALAGVPSMQRRIDVSELKKGQVLLYDDLENYYSAGTVFNDILIMCRHKLRRHQYLIVRGKNKNPGPGLQGKPGVRIDLSRAVYLDNHGAPAWDEWRHTCTFLDFVAIPLMKDEISAIGVKSLVDRDVTRNYELQPGSITYATDDFGTIITETGQIPESDLKSHELGLALAKILSKPGASSAGVYVVNNGDKLAGMWLGVPSHSLKAHQGKCNLFMTADAIMANLEQMGLAVSPLLEQLWRMREELNQPQGESRESKKERRARKWAEYYDAMQKEHEQLEYDSAAEDEDNELIHGHNWTGHAVSKKLVNVPLIRLSPEQAAPVPKVVPPMTGGESAEQAINIAREHNKLDLNTQVRGWKHDMLLEGHAPMALKRISYYNEEASSDVRERLTAVLETPSMMTMRDYMQKLAPEWQETEDAETIPDRNGNPYFKRCGTIDAPRPRQKKKSEPEAESFVAKLQARIRSLAENYHSNKLHGCEKGEYTVPANTKKNIDISLRAQAKEAQATPPQLTGQQKEEFEDAVALARQKYADGIGQVSITSYLEEGERGFLKTYLAYEDKSSGFSSRYRNLRKAVWAREHTQELTDLALCRLVLIAVAGKQITELSAIELVKYGLADIKEIFMKGEGHSPAKTQEGRFRLIWISSLIDLTVQSMLHKADNAAHIDAYQRGDLNCAALGLGHSPEGLERLVKAFRHEGVGEKNITSDARAFDLSIDASFIIADGQRRADNCKDPEVSRLIARYSHVLSSHVLNNNGDIWEVMKHGVTCSGQLSTTTQNTFARSVMAAFGGSKGWTCSGDDLVADVEFNPDRLIPLGVRSRDVARHFNEADFTSHLIDMHTKTAKYGNVEKLLWHMHDACVDISTNKERFGSAQYILRNTPGVLEDLTEIVKEFGIDTTGHVVDGFLAHDLS